MGRGRVDRRAIRAARVQGIAERYALGACGQPWDVEAGVAELCEASGGDPDVLAEMVAHLEVHRADEWWLPRALELLTAASATREAVDRHAEVIRARMATRAGGFTLAGFAERMNATMTPARHDDSWR